MALNGNAFTVNSASPLAVGTYPNVLQASGNVTIQKRINNAT